MIKHTLSRRANFAWVLGLLLTCIPVSQGFAQAKPSIPVGNSYSTGGDNALVTVVEFSDFQCPFCKRVIGTLDQIKKQYGDKVRVVFKHNPLPFHKDAPYASQAAIAAGKQGKFWEMHDKLFINTRTLKPDTIKKYAQELGLDMKRFDADLNSAETKAQIKADQALSAKLGARGTPHFFVNGKRLPGALPFPRFKAVIDEELKVVGAMVKAGKTPVVAYQERVKKNYAPPAPRKPRGGSADSKTVYNIQPGTSYGKGGAEPLVTIIEFSEFQCPFCSRVNPTMKKIHETYGDKVRVVFKHNPLPFHKDAKPASKAALAAGEQGKFWEMHDVLFANQRKLKAADLEKYAAQIGLDVAKFKADMKNSAYDKTIAADQALAARFGARGTPGFFINGRNLRGAQPFPSFKKIIDEEIKKAEALIAKGTARKAVYKALTAKGKKKASAPAPRGKGKAAADDKTVYNIAPGQGYAKGGAEPLVTIIEFSEFQCPFCSRVLPTMKKVHETYGADVRVIFKHNPLSFHKDAKPASKAALAAGEQGKFWEMHDLIFANQRKLKAADLEKYAGQLGLDMAKFKVDMADARFDKVIAADQALGARFGARGTPNFFVNGRNLRGAQPFPSFKRIIDEEIKKAKALIAKGTARKDIYKALTGKGKTKAAAPARRKPPKEDNKVYKVDVKPGDAIKGNPNAPVTIVEFSEFQCPFCSRVNPTIKKVMDTYGDKVRVVFKHNPLAFHKDAPLASEASLAAGAQGKFWEMHDALFANQRKLKRPDLEKYAAQIGLNLDQFNADLNSHKFKAQVDADLAQARSIGVRGTPNFFINGKKLTGAQPFPRFKAKIDEALKGAK
jgi:protein-disulfide isomerase